VSFDNKLARSLKMCRTQSTQKKGPIRSIELAELDTGSRLKIGCTNCVQSDDQRVKTNATTHSCILLIMQNKNENTMQMKVINIHDSHNDEYSIVCKYRGYVIGGEQRSMHDSAFWGHSFDVRRDADEEHWRVADGAGKRELRAFF
jgi:hypothetical protein